MSAALPPRADSSFAIRNLFWILTLCLGMSALAASASGGGAESPVIERLEPTKLSELPESVRRALVDMGCTVPQYWNSFSRHGRVTNAIRGEFAAAGQEDFAVLCSIDGRSRPIIFWGGTARCEGGDFSAADDSDFVEGVTGVDGTLLVFARRLVPVRLERSAGGPPQGIDDESGEKFATRSECRNRQWRQTTVGAH